MCGIFGIFFDSSLKAPSPSTIERAVFTMRHRGPDDEGYAVFSHGESAPERFSGSDTVKELDLPHISSVHTPNTYGVLGFRRLSIVDLSVAAHQPMCSADERFWLVFNGEIYNYIELRNHLLNLGHRFTTRSDSEVVIHAYREWGVNAFARFVGMFAIVIHDVALGELIFARDQFGIKPLNYAPISKGVAFASEIKALLELPQVASVCNPNALSMYLEHGFTDYNHETFFKGIHQLPPSTYAVLKGKSHDWKVLPTKYYEPVLRVREQLDCKKAADLVKQEFFDSVGLHMRADVPIGICLSGGIDSSSIASVMRCLRSDQELHAFSYISKDPGSDEEAYVDVTAHQCGVRLHKLELGPQDLATRVDKFLYHQEQPVRGIGSFAHYCVYSLMSESGIKVSLDGQGADELFAGYDNFLPTRFLSLLQQHKWVAAILYGIAVSKRPGVTWQKILQKLGLAMMPTALQATMWRLHNRAVTPNGINPRWFRGRISVSVPEEDGFSGSVLRKDLYSAVTRSVLPRLLRGQDRNSSAHSVEGRVPFVTPKMLELAFSLPESCLIDQSGLNKVVLRSSMRGIVPDKILNNRKKIGFGVPEEKWISGLSPWIDENINIMQEKCLPFFDEKTIVNKWREMKSGRAALDYRRIWFWVNVIRWSEQYNVKLE